MTRRAGESPSISTKVLVVEPDHLVRRGLRDLLESEDGIEVIAEASTAREAVVAIPDVRPDVALIDLSLPGDDAILCCREIAAQDPAIRCLILSSDADHNPLRNAMRAGAHGVVHRDGSEKALVEQVRRSGIARRASGSAAPLDASRRGEPGGDGLYRRLTTQERELLNLLGEGLTNREISERMHLAEKTVRNYVSSVLAKLEMPHRTQAALYAAKRRSRRSA